MPKLRFVQLKIKDFSENKQETASVSFEVHHSTEFLWNDRRKRCVKSGSRIRRGRIVKLGIFVTFSDTSSRRGKREDGLTLQFIVVASRRMHFVGSLLEASKLIRMSFIFAVNYCLYSANCW